MEHAVTTATQEQHDLFANMLSLLLPEVVRHTNRSENITPLILEGARRGSYANWGDPGRSLPYYFEAPYYCGHLKPLVLEIWRACYLAK
jgi:hypothetical protein